MKINGKETSIEKPVALDLLMEESLLNHFHFYQLVVQNIRKCRVSVLRQMFIINAACGCIV